MLSVGVYFDVGAHALACLFSDF